MKDDHEEHFEGEDQSEVAEDPLKSFGQTNATTNSTE